MLQMILSAKMMLIMKTRMNRNLSNLLSLYRKNIDLEEYCSKLSIERINFQFEKYGKYPDDYFQPSVYFYKFLAVKPEYIKNLEYQEKEYLDKIQMKNMKKLKNNHENLLNILSEEEEKELKKCIRQSKLS